MGRVEGGAVHANAFVVPLAVTSANFRDAAKAGPEPARHRRFEGNLTRNLPLRRQFREYVQHRFRTAPDDRPAFPLRFQQLRDVSVESDGSVVRGEMDLDPRSPEVLDPGSEDRGADTVEKIDFPGASPGRVATKPAGSEQFPGKGEKWRLPDPAGDERDRFRRPDVEKRLPSGPQISSLSPARTSASFPVIFPTTRYTTSTATVFPAASRTVSYSANGRPRRGSEVPGSRSIRNCPGRIAAAISGHSTRMR